MSSSILSYQFRLHLIVLIFGFTGILGALIQLPSLLLVFYRTAIACLALAIWIAIRKGDLFPAGTAKWKWFATGLIVGLHWFFFFESIKISTVSVALVSLSSTAMFTSVFEPLFHRKKFQVYELVFSVLIIIGMILVLRFEYRYALGILYGVICAMLASLFTVLNSRFVSTDRAETISFYELLGGMIFMITLNLISDYKNFSITPSSSDLIYLFLLGIVATTFAFVVGVEIMKHLSAFTVSLTINLEPLYGILLALVIFGESEYMSPGFYLGFALILSTILFNAYMKKKNRKRNSASVV